MGNCAKPPTHDEPPADYQDGANQQASGGFGNTEQVAYTAEQQAAYATTGPYDTSMAVEQQVVSGGYEVQQPSYGMDGNAVGQPNYGMPGANGGGLPPVMPGPSYPGGDGAMPPVSGGMGGGGDGQTYATYEEAQAAADAANAQAGAGSYGGPSNYQPAYQGPGPDPQPQPDYQQYPSGPMMGAPGPMMTGAPGPMMTGASGPMMGAPLPRGQTVDDAPVVQSSGAMAASGGMPVGGGDVVSGGLPAGNAYPDPMPQPSYDQPQPSGGYPTADAQEMPTAGGAYGGGATVMPAGYDGGAMTGYPQGQMMPPASGVMPPASGVSPPVQAVY